MPPDIPTTTLLAVFAATALAFVVVWMFVSWWLSRRRGVDRRIRPVDDSDPTILLDDVFAGRSGLGWWRRTYRQAQDRLERAELQLDPWEALSIVLFCGVVLAALVFFWRYEEGEVWMTFPAFFLGAAVPLSIFVWRQRAWQQRIQDQLPDMVLLLA